MTEHVHFTPEALKAHDEWTKNKAQWYQLGIDICNATAKGSSFEVDYDCGEALTELGDRVEELEEALEKIGAAGNLHFNDCKDPNKVFGALVDMLAIFNKVRR